MRNAHLPAWPLVVAALLAPAALHAQGGTLVCKDGSTGSTAAACTSHGGVDSVATKAAMNARGGKQPIETGRVDTSQTGATGMSDTTLKAKPGVQTGPSVADTGMKGMATDTGKAHTKTKYRHHRATTRDSTHTRMQPDSAGAGRDSTHY